MGKFSLIVVLLLGTGCTGHVQAEPEPEVCSADFNTCTEDLTAKIECTDGACVCYLPRHPGENRFSGCHTGAPDGVTQH